MKIYNIKKIKLTSSILAILACLLLLSCSFTKTDEEGEEVSNTTSAAEESKKLEKEVDAESLKANEKELLSAPELKSWGLFQIKF